MKSKKVLMLNKVDREDYWVTGYVFPVVLSDASYKDNFDGIISDLLSPEFERLLVNDYCLVDDLFDGDETFKLTNAYWRYEAVFVFTNNDGDEVEFELSADYVNIVEF